MRLKRILAISGLIVLASFMGITLYFANAKTLVREYQVAEMEGRRQREYKIYGFIPYEKQESAPDLHVNADYWKALKRAGLAVGPEVDPKRKDLEIVRMRRDNGDVQYSLHTTLKGDFRSLVSFYGAQLRKPGPVVKGSFDHHGASLTGTNVDVMMYLHRKGAKPGEDEIQFWLEVPGP